jgi:hypothetical protein
MMEEPLLKQEHFVVEAAGQVVGGVPSHDSQVVAGQLIQVDEGVVEQ